MDARRKEVGVLEAHQTNKQQENTSEMDGAGAGSSEWSEKPAASEEKGRDIQPGAAGWNGWRSTKVAHRILVKT